MLTETRLLLGAATACAALAIPSVASAKDYCVGAPAGCTGAPVPGALLSLALEDAESNGTADRFIFAPGVFESTFFAYDSPERVQIIGAGAGKTVLRANQNAPALELSGNDASSVSDLTIEPTADSTGGLTLNGGHARGVAVDAKGAASVSAGVTLRGNATFERGSVDVGASGSSAIVAESGSPTVTGSTVIAHEGYGFITIAEEATVRRSTLAAKYGAVVLDGHTTVSDTLVDLRDRATGAVTTAGIIATPNANASVTVDAERVTVVGSTPATTDTVGVYAHADDKSGAAVRVRDSVISGIGVPVLRSATDDSTADLSTRRSAYPAPVEPAIDSGPGTLEQLNRLNVSPRFVNAAGGNFRLAAGSPLIDAGSPDPLPAGATDRDGRPRASDGNGDCRRISDIGAFEYQGTKVKALARAAATAIAGQAVGFSAAGSCIPGAGTPSIRWRFDDGGSASGATVTHAFATAGLHTATVTVSDSHGHAAQATASVAVGAPPPSPPQITRLRVAPTRVAIGSELPKLVRTAAKRPLATISFRVSKRATVALRFAKFGGLGTARTVKPTLRARARKGTNRIRFAARLTRKVALKPGSYRLTAIATDGAGRRSKPVRTRFTVVKSTRR